MRNMNATFFGAPGGEGLGFTRDATRNNDSSSSGIIGGGGGGGGDEKVRVLETELGTVVVLTVKTTARGRQRRRAQKRESGVGDSMASASLHILSSVELSESKVDFE